MTALAQAARDALEEHRSRGREFAAGGVRSFVLDVGDGDPVLLMHGVPASSFLYRKLATALEHRGLRAVAFDLPGLGFAERPDRFDYSWTGLGRFAAEAIDALGIDRYHLVVHDIGGPVGFELAASDPSRMRSLTILNTLIDVDGFRKPWVMRPFGVRGLGEAWLTSMNAYSIQPLMWAIGVQGRRAVPAPELAAYAVQLKLGDGGKAFLRIMRGFEPTAEKARLYTGVVRGGGLPVEVVWGENDPALPIGTFGAAARAMTVGAGFTAVRAKHFLPEDQPEAIAARIALAASRSA